MLLQPDVEQLIVVTIVANHRMRRVWGTLRTNLDTAREQNVKLTALKLQDIMKCSRGMIIHSNLTHKWKENSKSNECKAKPPH